jgi:hypothetical protein
VEEALKTSEGTADADGDDDVKIAEDEDAGTLLQILYASRCMGDHMLFQ